MTEGKVRVLYVEDEPSLAELLRAGLAMFGMIVNPIYCSAEELLRISSRFWPIFWFWIRLRG
jgi:hypothetical protein